MSSIISKYINKRIPKSPRLGQFGFCSTDVRIYGFYNACGVIQCNLIMIQNFLKEICNLHYIVACENGLWDIWVQSQF